MNANELAEDLEGAKLVILRLNEMLRQQQAEILAGKIMIKGYGKVIDEQQAEITRLKLEWQYMADLTEKLQDFAIWMTGCGYDFCQHEYFIKCRDELLKGIRNE